MSYLQHSLQMHLFPSLFLFSFWKLSHLTTFDKHTYNGLPKCQRRLFADDTNIFNFGKNLSTMINNTNVELEKLSNWLWANKLMVNNSKTNYCLFHPLKIKAVNDFYNVKMGDKWKQSNNIKYLGIKLDNNLTWENHVHKVKSDTIKYTSMFGNWGITFQNPAKCRFTTH